jgi:hypothetical protein
MGAINQSPYWSWFVVTFCACFGCLLKLNAATVTAKSVAFADVNSAVISAADGDTVIVPPGIASWTSTLTLTKSITLQGQTRVEGADPSNFNVKDETVILDDVPRTPQGKAKNQAKASALIYGNFSSRQRPRITGLTFKKGETTGKGFTGVVYLEGTCRNVRIDHCSFYKLSRYNLIVRGNLFGVMDHCSALNDTGNERFWITHETYGNERFGDGSWTDDPKFGTDQAFYIEDCAFTSVNGKHGALDGAGGMRRVVRHCYFRGCVASLHGTETGGRQRGSRMVETYSNTFDLRGDIIGVGGTGFLHRAGTGLYWGNTFLTDPTFTRGCQLQAKRQLNPFRVWGGANGKNPLDSNDTEGDGTYVAGHPPHLYWSGKVSRTAHDSVQQTGAGWKINQWADFEVTNTVTGQNSLILSNTSDTLALARAWSGVGLSHYTAGESFVIYRLARASLDQPGMGKGDLITGNPPVNSRWPNQQSEPLYAWLNTNNGSSYTKFFTLSVDEPIPTIRENRDFYNWDTKFDGSKGLGAGPRSGRSSTCTQGVGYWATDEKTLYVATAPDTWAAYYKPFVYPHPLVQSSVARSADNQTAGRSKAP